MLKVGLTGGIACGKTVVREMLEHHGAFTIDADTIVHQLMGPHTALSRLIGEAFGPEVLSKDGSVDRTKLGALVFSNLETRERLNQMVHPRVIEEEKRRLADAERGNVGIAVVDASLMIEVGTHANYNHLVVVYCPRALQIERVMKRDGCSEEEAAKRIDSQIPAEQKKQYADSVIDTSGSLDDTERQVDRLWKKLQTLI
jgi:dephospho-CoA kinase